MKRSFINTFISLLAQRNEPKKVQPVTWFRAAELPGVYTPLGGAAHKERATSGSRTPYGVFIPPAAYSAESLIRSLRSLCPVFRGAARLREMACKTFYYCEQCKDPFRGGGFNSYS